MPERTVDQHRPHQGAQCAHQQRRVGVRRRGAGALGGRGGGGGLLEVAEELHEGDREDRDLARERCQVGMSEQPAAQAELQQRTQPPGMMAWGYFMSHCWSVDRAATWSRHS